MGVPTFQPDGPRRREISGRLNLCEDTWGYQNFSRMDPGGWGGEVGVPKCEPDGPRRKEYVGGTKISGMLIPMRGYMGVPKFQAG